MMDGVHIGLAAVGVDGQATTSFTIAANAWGADGQRSLQATIQRGVSGAVVNALNRSVAVAADASHWSAQSGNDVLWFDPNTLTALADGSAVTSWTASVGGITVTTFNSAKPSAAPIRILTDSTGHRVVLADGTGALRSTQVWATTAAAGFTQFSDVKFLQQATTWSYPFTINFKVGTVDYRTHFGIQGNGTDLTLHQAGDGTAGARMANGVSLNNWVSLLGVVDSTKLGVGVGDTVGATNTFKTTTWPAFANQGVMLAGTSRNGIFQEGIKALMGDQISVQGTVNMAFRQEMAT